MIGNFPLVHLEMWWHWKMDEIQNWTKFIQGSGSWAGWFMAIGTVLRGENAEKKAENTHHSFIIPTIFLLFETAVYFPTYSFLGGWNQQHHPALSPWTSNPSLTCIPLQVSSSSRTCSSSLWEGSPSSSWRSLLASSWRPAASMSGTLRRSSKVLDLYSCPSEAGQGLFFKVSSSRWCLAGLLPSIRKLQVFISDLPLKEQQKWHGNKTKDTRAHMHGAFPVDRVHVLLVVSALSSSPSPTFRLQTHA